jgi:hypothetical protein
MGRIASDVARLQLEQRDGPGASYEEASSAGGGDGAAAEQGSGWGDQGGGTLWDDVNVPETQAEQPHQQDMHSSR